MNDEPALLLLHLLPSVAYPLPPPYLTVSSSSRVQLKRTAAVAFRPLFVRSQSQSNELGLDVLLLFFNFFCHLVLSGAA